jgi:hypothetical protein
MQVHLDKSLSELESSVWGEPEFDSDVVGECHRLRTVPLRAFTIENLRLMIAQEVGLEYLVPLAIEHLEANPFVEGDYYPGDLLASVVGTPREFWTTHDDLRLKLCGIVSNAVSLVNSIDLPDNLRQKLAHQLSAFNGET